MLRTSRTATALRHLLYSLLPVILSVFAANELNAQCSGGFSSFPYTEDFELNDGGWIPGGTSSDWVYGVPGKTLINAASSGMKCWMIGQASTSFYNYGERSFLQSPCFNMSGLQRPFIRFDIFWELERQYDGASLQYSIDGGINWSSVGAYGDATDCMNQNWFNTSSINGLSGLTTNRNGWSGNIQNTSGSCQGGGGSGGWLEAKHLMPYLAGKSNVMFRFIFGSGTTCNDYDGFAFDNIYIAEAAPAIQITAQSTYETCLGGDASIILNVSGGTTPFTYNWQPAVSSINSANNLSSGTYTVTVSDGQGCNKQLSLFIPRSPAPGGAVQVRPDTCFTARGSAVVNINTGVAPYSYLWNNGETTRYITGLASGSYSVMVTDSAGCNRVFDALIGNFEALKLDLGVDLTFCPAQPFSLNSPSFTSYLWSTGDTVSGIPVNLPGTYWLVVTDDRGCVASDTLEVAEDCLNEVLVPNAFSPNGDKLNDVFYAIAVKAAGFQMEIFDRWGRPLFATTSLKEGWDGTYQGKESPQGIYIWKMRFLTAEKREIVRMGTVSLIR